MSVVAQEYEKNMFEAYMQKVVMNGSVPTLLDSHSHDKIKARADALVDVFYNGDPLTDYEEDVERMYLMEKYNK